ncbi:hypothetical protein [Bizionia paragorgiae]|uniref:hypothetical protein n=1 Tax=Bizionia paragorgiae TaxID=283786 RepID=UPI003A8F1476
MKSIPLFLLSLLFVGVSYAQVGIGTINPDASAALDIRSNSQGLLAPRMTSAERTAIASPAESLLVFDTDERAFYYYDTTTTTWIRLNASSETRTNYKLIKSDADLAAELSAGGGSKYLLDENTYYEINGTINLARPIDLNNAYIAGEDVNEDILEAQGTGTVFEGDTGGSIRNLTLKGAKAFNITGTIPTGPPGLTANSALIVQNTIIAGMNTSVGQVSNLGMYFANIVQFMDNTDGITYSNIGNLLLNNQGWQAGNNGTYETFTGEFGLIEKVSGFSTVDGSAVAIDVSADPKVRAGVVLGTVFSGSTTASSGYINGYTTDSYPGYNFNNSWTVNAPGIPRESDDVATGDINFSAPLGIGVTTSFGGNGAQPPRKITGSTTSNNLFRFERDGNNKIRYKGNKKRYFGVNASISFRADISQTTTYVLYIAKGEGAAEASEIVQTKVYGRAFDNQEIIALPIIGTIELKTDDYIEVWAERFSGNGDMLTVSLNLTIR